MLFSFHFFENHAVHVIICIYIYIYIGAVCATEDNVAHARGIVDTQDYKHIFRICNLYCFTQQQWIHERASNVRYTTNIAYLAKRSRLTLHMDILFHSRVDGYC